MLTTFATFRAFRWWWSKRLQLSDFDFELPEERIALRPAMPRGSARMLIVHGDGRLEDRRVTDLPNYLQPSDVLVFNETRVIPAALTGVRPARDDTGRDVSVDINLTEQLSENTWRALARPGKRLKAGDQILIAETFTAELTQKHPSGEIDLRFNHSGEALHDALHAHGAMPLPPYIARRRAADGQDRTDYQTIFAADAAGSVAAPTAGLHFTPSLLGAVDASGAQRKQVTLHVGLGTFAPVKDDQLERHTLHEEWRHLSDETAAALNAARRAGGRIVPVGTTALRTLESCCDGQGHLSAETGPTNIFIKPGDRIRATDMLMTNFHLPKSTLFMLVCALMGVDIMQKAYAHAVKEEYRFYSYGDACLLIP